MGSLPFRHVQKKQEISLLWMVFEDKIEPKDNPSRLSLCIHHIKRHTQLLMHYFVDPGKVPTSNLRIIAPESSFKNTGSRNVSLGGKFIGLFAIHSAIQTTWFCAVD